MKGNIPQTSNEQHSNVGIKVIKIYYVSFFLPGVHEKHEINGYH